MTAWKLAMLAAFIPVVAAEAGRLSRLRVWAVMFGASLISWLLYSLWLFVAVDIIAAALILWPPRNVWQKAIGLVFIAMLLLTTGYVASALEIFSSATPDPYLLQDAHSWLGWLALGLLLVWTGDDAFGLAVDRDRVGGRVSPADLGRDQ